jgi:hypothetical protein
MADYSKAKTLDWWYDAETNEYCAILETVEGKWRFITTPKHEEKK